MNIIFRRAYRLLDGRMVYRGYFIRGLVQDNAIQAIIYQLSGSGNHWHVTTQLDCKPTRVGTLYQAKVFAARRLGARVVKNSEIIRPSMRQLGYVYNDAGRAVCGYDSKNDCVVRAMALVCEGDYASMLDLLCEKTRQCTRRYYDPLSYGVYLHVYQPILCSMGFRYVPLTRTVNRPLPKQARWIIESSGHIAAVIDGVVNDTWDSRFSKSSRSRSRKITGYWQ